MPKLPVLTGKTVIDALKKIGFQAARKKALMYKWKVKMGA